MSLSLLVALPELPELTISLVMRVCLSVCLPVRLSAWNNSAPTGRIFMKFDI